MARLAIVVMTFLTHSIQSDNVDGTVPTDDIHFVDCHVSSRPFCILGAGCTVDLSHTHKCMRLLLLALGT